MQNSKNTLFLLLLILFFVFPIVSSLLGITYPLELQRIAAGNYGPILFYLSSVLLLTLAVLPATFFAILSGYFFPGYGLGIVIICYMLSATFGLMIGKKLKKSGTLPPASNRSIWKKFQYSVRENELLFVILSRLSPALPFAATNLALSAMNVSWKNYLPGSLAGMLPRTLLLFWIGKNSPEILETIKHPLGNGNYEWYLIVFFIVSAAGIAYIAVKRK